MLSVEASLDDGVGDVEDRLHRAVVLLELHHLRAELLVEGEDVPHVGAAPAVDRLVVVPHDTEVLPLAGEEAKDFELRAVRVLVLVDEEERVLFLPAREDVGARPPEAGHFADEVVEVVGLVRAERFLVAGVDDLR